MTRAERSRPDWADPRAPRTVRLQRLLVCLTLATTTILVHVSPQRVERRTEYRWCVDPMGAGSAWFERQFVVYVDGRPAGAPKTDRMFDIREEKLEIFDFGDHGR